MKRQEDAVSCAKLPLVQEESVNGQNGHPSPLFFSILVFKSVLGTNSKFCLLFTVLVLKTSREELENQLTVLNGRH